MKKLNVIYMGTSPFGIPAMRAIDKRHNISAVFTAAPKPKGRGMKLAYSPVYLEAEKLGIKYIYTPKTLRNAESQNLIDSIDADVIIVAAYGLIVPESILYNKKYGSVNIHPSDLPKHRGAAPLQHVIMSGDKKSAVCIIHMDSGIDTGPIIIKQEFPLSDRENFKSLHDKTADIGAELLLTALESPDTWKPEKQSNDSASYANKISKGDLLIKWELNADFIDRKIRALNTGCYFILNNERIKILKAEFLDIEHNIIPGKIEINKDNMNIYCKKGILLPQILQREGKKAVSCKEFILGTHSKSC